jgi:hypothetical protein
MIFFYFYAAFIMGNKYLKEFGLRKSYACFLKFVGSDFNLQSSNKYRCEV